MGINRRHTVFVSYRRHLSWAQASLVYKDLEKHGFDAFMDVRNLDSGEFDRAILDQIETCVHFVVVLVPGSLDRIRQQGDWLRREIVHALAHDRNVVPVIADGFEFGNLVLPPDVARLQTLNAVSIPPGYFESAMERLRTQFLKQPPSALAFGNDATPRISPPRLMQSSSNVFRWSESPSARRYVLEGSDDSDFRSSRVVYEGSRTSYSGWGRPLMYHRVKSIGSRLGDSGWSNIVRAPPRRR